MLQTALTRGVTASWWNKGTHRITACRAHNGHVLPERSITAEDPSRYLSTYVHSFFVFFLIIRSSSHAWLWIRKCV